MRVAVLEYDPSWPVAFENLKAELLVILGDIPTVTVEHVGSTSVPGLAAKTCIDIDIVVDHTKFCAAVSALSRNGYTYMPERGAIDRLAFPYDAHEGDTGFPNPTPNGEIRRAVYLNMPGGLSLRNHLATRNALRNDPALVKEYAEVKLTLARQELDTSRVYTAGKGEILGKVLGSSGELSGEDLQEIARVARAL